MEAFDVQRENDPPDHSLTRFTFLDRAVHPLALAVAGHQFPGLLPEPRAFQQASPSSVCARFPEGNPPTPTAHPVRMPTTTASSSRSLLQLGRHALATVTRTSAFPWLDRGRSVTNLVHHAFFHS